MKFYRHAGLSAVALLLFVCPAVYGLADNLGREFLVVFMRNEVERPLNVPLELFITTPNTIPVQVRVSTKGFTEAPVDIRITVVSGQVEKVELSHLLRLSWVQIESKVVYIHADNEIAVYGLNKERYSTDGFLLYPADVIGYEYYTVSHTPTNSYTMFALASKYDSTHVTVTFPEVQTGNPLRIDYRGRTYTNGDVMNISLSAFQSFQCLSYDNADLTGTHIVANMPVAAFSGNLRTWVGSRTSRDHLAIQLPPVQAYGKMFPIIPTPARTVGDIIRVISSRANAKILVEGPPPRYFTLGKPGSYADFVIPSNRTSSVSSEYPILVVQIVQSQRSADEKADPSMTVVTSTSQFMSDYVFSTPQYYNGDSYDNWLMLVAHNQEVSGLMLDNRPISSLRPEWSPVPGTVLVGTQLRIEAGPHAIRHASPVAKFSGYLYGMASKESYSFQIGTRMAFINQPCISTDSIFGDGVDNDCDGAIDEELCTGSNAKSDTDLDGRVNEDCAINRDIGFGVPDSGGRQFVLFFMDNVVEVPRYQPLEVYVTPLRAPTTTVQIESPGWFEPSIYQRKQVTFGRVETFYIPYTMRETGTGMTKKALFVTSDSDVVVYAMNVEKYSADAFLVLPIDVLGKEYYTITHWPNSVSSKCQIGVVGVSDGTRVDITFPSARVGRSPLLVDYAGKVYSNGDTLSVVMGRYSTLQLQSKGDLTGSRVRSTQRVAVMSGNMRTSVGSGSSRDHLAVMVTPTESWGKLYCTVPIPGRSTGDYFYVLASENDTHVEVTSKDSFTLDAGDSRQLIFSSMELVAVRSDRPILVTQVSQSQQTTTETGDPTMIVLPAVEQWANAYTFSTTASSEKDYQSYVVMVCPGQQVKGLLFDGKYLPDLFTTWYAVAGTNYTGTSFMIQRGAHTVQHVDPTVTFSVIVYGNADKESYGFAAGMRLARINAPCETTPSQRGDGIDNDCDGRIDEEICDGADAGKDVDSDGAVSEDCAVYIPVIAVPTAPPSDAVTDKSSTTTSQNAGIAGPPGLVGAPGSRGGTGPPGVPGFDGLAGKAGVNGIDGFNGAKGEPGDTGLTGSKGATGEPGPIGRVGAPGAAGAQGLQGERGIAGIKGSNGASGLSIKGEKGLGGLLGAAGPIGPAGKTGSSGLTGLTGPTGLAGLVGAPGTKGVHGSEGKMGPGYEDEDECSSSSTNPCSDLCVNSIGSFHCECKDGYRLDQTLHSCVGESRMFTDSTIDRLRIGLIFLTAAICLPENTHFPIHVTIWKR